MNTRKLKSPINVKDSTFPQTDITQLPIMDIGASEVASEETEINNSNLNKIIVLLRELSGHDFSLYKKSTLFRRIERRKEIHKIEKIRDYFHFLQENPNEAGILFNELLIGVTSFFRDAAMWQILKEKIFPDLINELPDGYALRAWVPACSTGEEAYSLAIVFKEAMENVKMHKKLTLQIFATDLDSQAIAKARKGSFTKKIATDVSPEQLSLYFTEEAEGFRVNSDIREMVMFAPQNVIKDPPFIKLDFLSCRNMLIYLEPVLQNKLITLFNYCLKPGGIMVLGTSETLGDQNEGFNELNGKWKIFKRSTKGILPILIDSPSSFYFSKVAVIENKLQPKGVETLQVLTDQILFERFNPDNVLAHQDGEKPKTKKQSSTGRMKELEIQLLWSSEELQSITEQLKTSQEDQKSINEEHISSLEEMQNLNEELQTVNMELQSKVSDLLRANDDIKNLLSSPEIATLFLDNELNIRRFSDQATMIFKLRNNDIGRPFTDLVTNLQYSEIDDHARQVIKTLKSVVTEAAARDGKWFNIRIMPYRTLDDRIDGLIMTFTDITAAKKIKLELKEIKELLCKSKENLHHQNT